MKKFGGNVGPSSVTVGGYSKDEQKRLQAERETHMSDQLQMQAYYQLSGGLDAILGQVS